MSFKYLVTGKETAIHNGTKNVKGKENNKEIKAKEVGGAVFCNPEVSRRGTAIVGLSKGI